MRFAIATFMVAALVFGGASTSSAKDTTNQFTGEISRIDSARKILVVKQQGPHMKEMNFALASNAEIKSGYLTKDLEDLKPGERVKVSYVDQGSKHEAQRIDLLHAKTAAAK